jgi:hypothetical protein
MNPARYAFRLFFTSIVASLAAALACSLLAGQQAAAPLNWTAEQDHRNMMEQLGIQALRPGPSGNENDPNHANYDESKANIYGDLPNALKLKNGQTVTSAEQWWHQRRPEIVNDFETEILGRIPADVPRVTWTAEAARDAKTGVFPVHETHLIGHVDNSAYPAIKVEIDATLVTPANAQSSVPS